MKSSSSLARGFGLALVVSLPFSLGACASDEVIDAEAQNPMGDEATAAVADTDGSPSPGEASAGESPAFRFGSSAAIAQRCMQSHQVRLDSAAASQQADSVNRYGAARNAVQAKNRGWYRQMPEFRDGAILPCSRIVAYYGHPSSTRMGALGEFPKEEMLRRFKAQVAEFEKADPSTPVVPALHMVSVVAQADPGTTGKYRTITSDEKVQMVYDWAREAGAIFIVDIQVGQDDIRNILPRFEWILKNPDVHLAVDPEFYMRDGVQPGRKIGTMYASDINYVSEYLAELVNKYNLPPKVLVIHRFTRPMVQGFQDIVLRPEVQYVSHMDGWGAPWLKYDSFKDYIVDEPIQFTGWKNFYHNDTKKGDPLVSPAELMQLHPVPLYIQYQ